MSVGQADSTLRPPAREDFSAVFRPHPFHKAVLFAALAFFGLIGTKHFLWYTSCIKAKAGNIIVFQAHLVF